MNNKHYQLIIGCLLMLFVGYVMVTDNTQHGATTININIYESKLSQIEYSSVDIKAEEPRHYDTETRLVTVYKMKESDAIWWSKAIHNASKMYDVPPEIIIALIATESSFRKNVSSHAGAIGPAQVIPRVWEDIVQYDLSDPAQNIMAGAHILKRYKGKCGNWKCALAAYNVGITNYRKGYQKGAQQRYLAKITSHLALNGSNIL